MRLVVDSSVVVKWFATEPLSDVATSLREHDLDAPDLLLPECANVFWKKARRGEFTQRHALLAMTGVVRSGIHLHPSVDLAGAATRIALALDHAAYDCFYLALAERQGAVLVTADAGLARAVTARPEATTAVVQLLAEFGSP